MSQGSVAHNHLQFYVDAINVMVSEGDWEQAERYAAALEDFTRPEPLPWSEFFIARSRALAAWGLGRVYHRRSDAGQRATDADWAPSGSLGMGRGA